MHLVLTETWEKHITEAIRIGKETGIEIIWERDGCHGTNDLQVLLTFQQAGFAYDICNYKGKYEAKAIRVSFKYAGEREV